MKKDLSKGLSLSLSLSADSVTERFRNFKHKTASQTGRSMIEILGVLTIIGVLSVGGIAGYSKAMMKLKLNRWTSDITHLITNIQLMYMTQGQYEKKQHK